MQAVGAAQAACKAQEGPGARLRSHLPCRRQRGARSCHLLALCRVAAAAVHCCCFHGGIVAGGLVGRDAGGGCGRARRNLGPQGVPPQHKDCAAAVERGALQPAPQQEEGCAQEGAGQQGQQEGAQHNVASVASEQACSGREAGEAGGGGSRRGRSSCLYRSAAVAPQRASRQAGRPPMHSPAGPYARAGKMARQTAISMRGNHITFGTRAWRHIISPSAARCSTMTRKAARAVQKAVRARRS